MKPERHRAIVAYLPSTHQAKEHRKVPDSPSQALWKWDYGVLKTWSLAGRTSDRENRCRRKRNVTQHAHNTSALSRLTLQNKRAKVTKGAASKDVMSGHEVVHRQGDALRSDDSTKLWKFPGMARHTAIHAEIAAAKGLPSSIPREGVSKDSLQRQPLIILHAEGGREAWDEKHTREKAEMPLNCVRRA